MEFLNVVETSLRWNVPVRKVTAWARDGRIPGAQKSGREWLIPENSSIPLDGRTKESRYVKEGIDTETTTVSYTEVGGSQRVMEEFEKKYKKKPDASAFTPYRICPIGAHSDHNLGKITGFAIDKGIHIAYGVKHNGVIEMASLQFPKKSPVACQ